ncbi:hypothetical protein COC52_26785 [Priestia megaterium]|nr:hypothetical protein COC52_26785 [Priestia megaterium]
MIHAQYVSTFTFYVFFDLDLDNKVSGRCDNCNSSYFKSSVKGSIFLRECRECGMKKSI